MYSSMVILCLLDFTKLNFFRVSKSLQHGSFQIPPIILTYRIFVILLVNTYLKKNAIVNSFSPHIIQRL